MTKEQKDKIVSTFHVYINEAIKYRDYLLPEVREILSRYETFIYNLEASGEHLSQSHMNEVNLYNQMVSNVKISSKKNTPYVRKLTPTGYANIFLVLLLIIACGITLGSLIWIF